MKKNKNGKKYQWGGQSINQIHGVTLIALIVTIIILLILAGAVINMAVGADGIFRKASDAVDKHNNAVAEEEEILENLINIAENYDIGESGPTLIGNIYTDTNEDTAYVPSGFTPSTEPR